MKRTDRCVTPAHLLEDTQLPFFSRMLHDERTGMPAKVEYGSTKLNSAPSTVGETCHRFGQLDGFELPKGTTLILTGHKYADIVIEASRLNTGLKSEDLSKKQ